MNPFTKLQNLNRFLKDLKIPEINCKTHLTTANADATSRLDKATGDQLVLARPEMDGADPTDATISTVFFVLSRDLGTGKTPAKEDEQYERLLEKAKTVFYHIKNATESGCHLLAGLEMSRYSVTPETSIFGGWVGWSVEIVFE